MSKARREAERRERERIKRNKLLRDILIALTVIAIVIVGMAGISVYRQRSLPSQSLSIPLGEDGGLSIDRSSLINGFNYVDWGGEEELILYQKGGAVTAAFDTCEECYSRGSVHFTAQGQNMICSICGTTLPLSNFGAQAWGSCQPVSVPNAARFDNDSQIVISSGAMDYAAQIFQQWDTGVMLMSFANYVEQTEKSD